MTNLESTTRLNPLIADATVFYQKLRHYHWNVNGKHFFVLHDAFEKLYTAWAGVIDDLAERVRTLDDVPVHTLAGVLELATLEEDESIPDATEMVRTLIQDLRGLHASVTDVLDLAEEEGSRGTADLLSKILDHLEKDLWMLNAWVHQDGVDEAKALHVSTKART